RGGEPVRPHHRARAGRGARRGRLPDGLAQPRRDPGLHGIRRVSALLTVRGLEAWYDESHILHGVDLEVRSGEVVTLLGRNGAGKTTTLKSIMGIVRKRRGSVRLGDAELIGRPSNVIARLGIAFCPEERGIFASLNVDENLRLAPVVAPGGLDGPAIFGLFPNLKERLRSQGTKLSGGEQQMLAIARILRTGARLLLLDSPAIFGLFPNLKERLRSQGTKLSGGEQQMLAIARILRTGARLLLLD